MEENLKNMGEAIKRLMCKETYDTRDWPEDFRKTVMIPLKKKPSAKECSEHRIISLMSHASKITERKNGIKKLGISEKRNSSGRVSLDSRKDAEQENAKNCSRRKY